jgi:DNA-binding transcriptional LysR family regulator
MTTVNLHRLSILLAVVESGGFSAAAHKLEMSQPSVSSQVRRLERSLSTRLIDRSGPQIRPTAEGEVMAEYARQVLRLTEQTLDAVHRVGQAQAGRLRVGGTTTPGTYQLPWLLARFRERHPEVECDLVVGEHASIIKQVLNGELGLAILSGRPEVPQLCLETIVEERLLLVASPRHGLAGRGVAVPAAELAGERFLLREPGSQTREAQESALVEWGLDIATVGMRGTETIKQSVAAGLGISLVSEHAVGAEVRQGRLAVIGVDPAPPTQPVVVGYRHNRLLTPAERAFLELVTGAEGRDAG